MATIIETIDRLCEERGIKGSKLCDDLGISRSTLTELRKGRAKSLNIKKATLIANYFDVPVEYLLGEASGEQTSPETQKAPTLNKKDERDIARRLEETLNLLESSDALMFDGEPLDQESMDLLKTSLQNQYTLAKKIAKQKFTPKKYRTDNEK